MVVLRHVRTRDPTVRLVAPAVWSMAHASNHRPQHLRGRSPDSRTDHRESDEGAAWQDRQCMRATRGCGNHANAQDPFNMMTPPTVFVFQGSGLDRQFHRLLGWSIGLCLCGLIVEIALGSKSLQVNPPAALLASLSTICLLVAVSFWGLRRCLLDGFARYCIGPDGIEAKLLGMRRRVDWTDVAAMEMDGVLLVTVAGKSLSLRPAKGLDAGDFSQIRRWRRAGRRGKGRRGAPLFLQSILGAGTWVSLSGSLGEAAVSRMSAGRRGRPGIARWRRCR